MNSFYEINATNVVRDIDTQRIHENSPIVEVFSALAAGNAPKVSANVLDKSVKTMKELASKAQEGDTVARSELNTIVRFAIEPKLLKAIELFNFMGTYNKIGYHEAAMMKTYNYEDVDARFQASSGDVPFAAFNWREYPIPTQTISSGFAIDYREIQSGNFDGSVAEGMNQVQIDMENKAVYYVINKLYNGLKNATGVKHFAETTGIAQNAVDDMLKVLHYYGKVNIMGDYAVVSQLNDFEGFKTIGGATIPFGDATVAEEIRKTGLVNWYKGAFVTELPNQYNFTKLNANGNNFVPYMPQGLLFFVPQGQVAPLQIFRRGGMTSMQAQDIVTRKQLTRFDIEIGAGVAEGMEHYIGLLSDDTYEVPAV